MPLRMKSQPMLSSRIARIQIARARLHTVSLIEVLTWIRIESVDSELFAEGCESEEGSS